MRMAYRMKRTNAPMERLVHPVKSAVSTASWAAFGAPKHLRALGAERRDGMAKGYLIWTLFSSPDSPTPPDSTRKPTARQPDSTDSPCKRTRILTD